MGLRDAAEGFYHIDEISDLRRVVGGPKQCQLVGEDSLGPLPEAVLHECLRVRVAVVGDHHVGLTIAWWTEDVHLSCELDLIPRLLLEVGEKVVVEAAILWGYDREETDVRGLCSGPDGG